ncbi:hypothetical protein R4Z10_18230 [Niallia sp. XMNu-256]|uniref:hypothetical protein n=1 Tax=Niallia sp. XMNu-256 TaxID=3082444 RepID=UPI0030CAB6E2
MKKFMSVLVILLGIILFFIGLELLGIIIAVVGLFVFPNASFTNTGDPHSDQYFYEHHDDSKSESTDSGDSGGGSDD